MTSHPAKTTPPPLIHHPSDALDFGCYDSSSQAWTEFDLEITALVAEYERSHLHYLKHSANSERRSSWTTKPN
jgi:hypothetical protein